MSKSAEKKFERYQDRLARRNFTPKVNPLTASWYFEKPYEKVGLVVLMTLGFWKLGGLIIGLF